jgi:hypothetical protein
MENSPKLSANQIQPQILRSNQRLDIQIEKKDRAFLQWTNLEYFVPVNYSEKKKKWGNLRDVLYNDNLLEM